MLDGVGHMTQPDQSTYRKQHCRHVCLETSLTVQLLHPTLPYHVNVREDQGAAKH